MSRDARSPCPVASLAPLLPRPTLTHLSRVTSFLVGFGYAIDVLGRVLVVIAGVRVAHVTPDPAKDVAVPAPCRQRQLARLR